MIDQMYGGINLDEFADDEGCDCDGDCFDECGVEDECDNECCAGDCGA